MILASENLSIGNFGEVYGKVTESLVVVGMARNRLPFADWYPKSLVWFADQWWVLA